MQEHLICAKVPLENLHFLCCNVFKNDLWKKVAPVPVMNKTKLAKKRGNHVPQQLILALSVCFFISVFVCTHSLSQWSEVEVGAHASL